MTASIQLETTTSFIREIESALRRAGVRLHAVYSAGRYICRADDAKSGRPVASASAKTLDVAVQNILQKIS